MEGNIVFVIMIAVGVIGGIIAMSIFFDRKRIGGLQEAAGALGLQFDESASQISSAMTNGFELFDRGRWPKSRNLIYGESNGTDVWIFDFQYTTGSGKNQSTHHQTVCIFSTTELQLPRFNLYREGLLSRIGSGVFGMQDIDFDTHPDFSKMYVLKGDSEVQIRELFHEQLLSFFETQDKNLCVEGMGERLLVYRKRTKVKPNAVKEFLGEGFGLFREFRATT